MAQCNICNQYYLHSCVELSATDVRTIKTKKGLSWSCRACGTLSNSIAELKFAILELKNQLQSKTSDQISDDTFEDLLHEMSERNERKTNLIIFNIPELQSRSADERSNHDKGIASNLITSLAVNIHLDNVKTFRVGKRGDADGQNRTRPLKIKLNGVDEVHKIIKQAKHLKNFPDFKDYSISLDRTPRQIKYYKKVKAELDQRTANGEGNLKIRYRKGLPVIVSEN